MVFQWSPWPVCFYDHDSTEARWCLGRLTSDVLFISYWHWDMYSLQLFLSAALPPGPVLRGQDHVKVHVHHVEVGGAPPPSLPQLITSHAESVVCAITAQQAVGARRQSDVWCHLSCSESCLFSCIFHFHRKHKWRGKKTETQKQTQATESCFISPTTAGIMTIMMLAMTWTFFKSFDLKTSLYDRPVSHTVASALYSMQR